MVSNDYDSSFKKFFEMGNENTTHIKNMHIIMTEIYKFLNGSFPPTMKIFKKGLPILLKKPKIINN